MSTLGDLLGALHRSRISGVLALRELRGITAGRCHRIYLRAGLIVAVETLPAGSPSAGIPPEPMDRDQVRDRLEELFRLDDAELTFHTARGNTGLDTPLTPPEFLHGRPRSRDQRDPRAPAPRTPPAVPPVRRRALEALGLPLTASGRDIQRAFRAMALRLHPDRHPEASDEKRAELTGALARLTQAYRTLTA